MTKSKTWKGIVKLMKMKKLLAIFTAGVLTIGMTACNGTQTVKEEPYVAKVNDQMIAYADYEKNFMIFKKQIEANVGEDIWTQDAGEGKTYGTVFKEQILEKLIEDEVLSQEASKAGLKVDEKEIASQLENFKKQIETNKDYKEYLEKNGISDDFIKKQMEIDNLLTKLRVDYDEKNQIPEEKIKKYYQENQAEFTMDEVRASHILFKTVDDNRLPLDETAKEAVKTKAQEILDRVKAGEDFAKLAKEHSEDPGSAENGGDLNFFPRGQMVKPFEDAAFSMEVGQISGLVESNFGYHIIKVTDKKNETSTFEEVQDRIKSTLMDEAYQNYIEELKAKTKIEKNEELLASKEREEQQASSTEEKEEKTEE